MEAGSAIVTYLFPDYSTMFSTKKVVTQEKSSRTISHNFLGFSYQEIHSLLMSS